MIFDTDIILSLVIITCVIILIFYEITKHYIQNTVQLWSNSYELLKEKNKSMELHIQNLLDQIDDREKEHFLETENLLDKIKLIEKQIKNK